MILLDYHGFLILFTMVHLSITKRILEERPVAFFCDFIHSCGEVKDMIAGRHAHCCVVENCLEGHTLLGGLLVQMYSKCDALNDALVLFHIMPNKHVHVWNTMIRALSRHRCNIDALELFNQMQQEGVLPEGSTYICAFSACASTLDTANGVLLHCRVAGCSSNLSDTRVGNALVNMYAKCGNLEDASRSFLGMLDHDVVSWTAILSAYSQQGHAKQALYWFHQMLQEGFTPNEVTFISLLSGIVSSEFLLTGIHVHARVINSEFGSDINLGNSLVSMYGRCSQFQDAYNIFCHMPKLDIVSCNAIISASTSHGMNEHAFEVFAKMIQNKITPNATTFSNIVIGCMCLKEVLIMHVFVTELGLLQNIFIATTLINVYGNHGSCQDSESTFFSMSEQNVISWNTMIGVYSQHSKCFEALELMKAMEIQGLMATAVTVVCLLELCGKEKLLAEAVRLHVYIISRGFCEDSSVANALIILYGKWKQVSRAETEFVNLHNRDIVSWTSMISLYVQQGHVLEALEMFSQMQEDGTEPDEVTYSTILYACARYNKLPEGESIYSSIIQRGYDGNVTIASVVVNMFGKCGKLDEARRVFDRFLPPNMVLWTSIIAVYAYHGKGEEAVCLFKRMRQFLVPDQIAFLCILTACSHAGLIDEGNYFLHCMEKELCLTSFNDHYGCMIGLLGRAGRLDEAEALFENMPQAPSPGSYTALLGACRYQDDVERAERTASCAFCLGVSSSSLYIMLSNIYRTHKLEQF